MMNILVFVIERDLGSSYVGSLWRNQFEKLFPSEASIKQGLKQTERMSSNKSAMLCDSQDF